MVAIVAGVASMLVAAASQAQHFQPQPFLSVPVGASTGPNSFVLADVNHDTHLDLIVIDQDDDEVAVLLGDGNGGFAAWSEDVNSFDLNDTPTAVAVADIGSPAGPPDGIPDLVVTEDGGEADILLGNGDGTFGSVDDSQDLSDLLSVANDLEGIVLTNFDNDPAPDLALLDAGTTATRGCSSSATGVSLLDVRHLGRVAGRGRQRLSGRHAIWRLRRRREPGPRRPQ